MKNQPITERTDARIRHQLATLRTQDPKAYAAYTGGFFDEADDAFITEALQQSLDFDQTQTQETAK